MDVPLETQNGLILVEEDSCDLDISLKVVERGYNRQYILRPERRVQCVLLSLLLGALSIMKMVKNRWRLDAKDFTHTCQQYAQLHMHDVII